MLFLLRSQNPTDKNNFPWIPVNICKKMKKKKVISLGFELGTSYFLVSRPILMTIEPRTLENENCKIWLPPFIRISNCLIPTIWVVSSAFLKMIETPYPFIHSTSYQVESIVHSVYSVHSEYNTIKCKSDKEKMHFHLHQTSSYGRFPIADRLCNCCIIRYNGIQ